MTDRPRNSGGMHGLVPVASFVFFVALAFGVAHWGAEHYSDACYDGRQGCHPAMIQSASRQEVRDVDRITPLFVLGAGGLLVIVFAANGAVAMAGRKGPRVP